MGTKISRDFTFLSAIYYEGEFLINNFDISLVLNVETDSVHEQNVAMDRIKYFINERLENSVFVQETETRIIEKYIAAGLKVCTLPEEPYDQIITIVILNKLNAICEGKLVVTSIHLNSILSDNVGFIYDIDDIRHLVPYKNGWWVENSNNISNKISSKKEKIVRLVKNNDWTSLGLDWVNKDNRSEIIFTPDLNK